MCFRSHQAYERPLLTVLFLKKWHQLLIWWRQQWEQSWKERLMKPLKLCPVEREQVKSNILPASWLQDYNSALFIQVLIKKSKGSQALMDSFWCICPSKTSKKSGASWCYVTAAWLCMHATGLFNVWTGLWLSYWRWMTVHLHAGTHAPRHGHAHTPSFEDLFMREALFLDVTVCQRHKQGKIDWQICRFGVYLPVHRPLLVWFLMF